MRVNLIPGLTLVLILFVTSAFSQNAKHFSEEPAAFLKQLEAYLAAADKRAAKELIDGFEPVFLQKFNGGQQRQIINLANGMMKKRMPAVPNFRDYVICIGSFPESDFSSQQFDDWMQSLEKSLGKLSAARFLQYIGTSTNLFKYNALFKSDVVAWYPTTRDLRFAYDSIPEIHVPLTDLKGKTRTDSTIIFNTQGIYFPTEFRFSGNGGKIYWTRAGLKEDEASAVIRKYNISLKTTSFTVDSAVFSFPKYFDKPLLGVVTEKLTERSKDADPTYPRFSSYKSEFSIPEIFKDVDYAGGASVHGARLLGTGTPESPAMLSFKREGKPFVEARSLSFLIEEKTIQAARASITLRLDTDSIVHPGLVFRFFGDKRELFLLRNNEGSAKTPWFNSYHQLDMDFEVLSWKLDETTIRFKAIPGAVESRALFESADYFREQRYIEIKGIDEESPLQMLQRLADKTKRETFSAAEVASFYRTEITQTRQILRRLSYAGFLLFDEETETITLKPRVRKYQLALNGKADYDVIQFSSVVDGSANNGELSLLNWDLRMFGVSRIFLSDSQNVVIYPKNQELVVHKNRDFDFAGRIMAGRFEFFGKKFDFVYDKFKLNLNNVDSLRLRVDGIEKDEFGKTQLVRVKTVIENVIGDILIDHPYNKSGRQSLAQYPIFNSVQNSYAYYQRGSILNNVYKRDNFYFQLDPYVVDSLDNFTNKGLFFQGTFVSAGILPDLREELRLQEDYSLGFKRTTPEEGMPIYSGKGTFINKLQLSHKGLRGDGKINYITATAVSDDFIFFPDSVNAFCRNLTVKASQEGNVEFPDVAAADVRLHWEPYKPNNFEVAQTKEAIMLYAGESKLRGKIAIGESGMTGSGVMEFASAEVASKRFRFKKEDFKSDTASFAFTARDEVKNDGTKEVAIKTDNVKADVSFKNRQGQFKSNSSDSYIEFPVNKYIAYMDELRWYMDKDEVDMNSSMNEIDLIGSRFVSTRADQDSITFVAPRAKYALADRTIRTDGVKLIRVADATIYPDQEKINVERNAVITTLKNSRINANNDLKYHDIYNASIDIISRKRYKASGDYDYEDATGKTQKITFTSITLDSLGNTTAVGEIAEAQNFSLSPQFEYKGKVRLHAPEKHLLFEGGVRLVHNCEKVNRNWLKFKSRINPENIEIPVDSFPRSVDNDRLISGLVLVKDSTHVYPVFLSRKQKTGDQELLTSRGILRYDKTKQEYQLSTKEKFGNPALPDDYVAMRQDNCDLTGEGKINFGVDLGQVKMTSYGSASHSISTDKTHFKTMIALDFFLAPEILKHMEETITGTSGLQAADVTSTEYQKAIKAIAGKEAAEKMLKDMGSTGIIKRLPDELNKTLVLSNVEFNWNTDTRSYLSEGWISISNIGKTPVNKMIKGKFELIKKRGGDILNLYLEVEPNKWYFFNYMRNIMYVLAADEALNKAIREMDGKQREMKTESGQPPFQFMIGIEKRKRDFVD